AGGNKAQGVHHLAVDSLASEGLLNRPAAGVVPLARVAAQDQNAHTAPLSFLRLCLSVVYQNFSAIATPRRGKGRRGPAPGGGRASAGALGAAPCRPLDLNLQFVHG